MLKTLKIAISIGMMSGTFKQLKMLNNPNQYCRQQNLQYYKDIRNTFNNRVYQYNNLNSNLSSVFKVQYGPSVLADAITDIL
jgi:hypothetical protein